MSIHLAAGTDVGAENQWRATPLLKVPREGHKAISELLINNGQIKMRRMLMVKHPQIMLLKTIILILPISSANTEARLVKNWKLKRDILASREAGKTVDSMTQSSCILVKT